MQIPFVKMQGVGNDYVYIDARQQKITNPAALARFVADRHFGVGSDGLVLLQNSAVADVKMQMYNADGSEGAMCGNAARCVAEFWRNLQETPPVTVTLETQSGVKVVRWLGGNRYCVSLGQPTVDLQHADKKKGWVAVNVGNPHAVVFPTQALDRVPVAQLGQYFNQHALFPAGVNVEFVTVIDPTHLAMRVWERGSGETLGCGTGAAAAVVAAVVTGRCAQGQVIRVSLPGGDLWVDYHPDRLDLIGPAVTVFQGMFTWSEAKDAH